MENEGKIAFVLSGGGKLASTELGMLTALVEARVRPDIVIGSSAGALIGSVFAGSPDRDGLIAVRGLWEDFLLDADLRWDVRDALARLVSRGRRRRTQRALRSALARYLMRESFEELPVHFECVGLDMVAGREVWFDSGPLVPALLVAAAAPAIMEPVKIGDTYYCDGGVVNPFPIDRAVRLGARTIYFLQITDMERSLGFPRSLWEVGLTGMVLRWRHQKMVAGLPPDVTVHMLPVGRADPSSGPQVLRRIMGIDLRDPYQESERRIREAYLSTKAYLATSAKLRYSGPAAVWQEADRD
ncbi:patatin-like phospholipase family protein [Actinomadura macrotermitis]|nr:patatin-like phospholipase family protein [Actinomadura macrotermitis]